MSTTGIIILLATLLLAVWLWRTLTGRGGLPPIETTPDAPIAFGYKIQWLAVPANDVRSVCEALAASDARFEGLDFAPCNWRSGLDRILASGMNPEVLVTPPVDGWVFAVNWTPAGEEVDGFFPLKSLSEEFGRACAFGSHRGVSLATWAVAEDGELRRCFAEADGETYVDLGPKLPEERDLDLLSWTEVREILEETVADPHEEDELFQRLPDERSVLDLAAAWSLNPSSLDQYATVGVGRIVRPRER